MRLDLNDKYKRHIVRRLIKKISVLNPRDRLIVMQVDQNYLSPEEATELHKGVAEVLNKDYDSSLVTIWRGVSIQDIESLDEEYIKNLEKVCQKWRKLHETEV